MSETKYGWSVEEWCRATSLGRTKVFALIGAREIQSVSAGRRRIITTQPEEFLEAIAKSLPTENAA